MSKREIHLLCTEADRALLQPVLEQLRAKGLRVSQRQSISKDDIVLAALSEGFYADSGKTQALLDLVAAGAEKLLPLQLDGAQIPDTLKNALYARNIISAAGRDSAQIAERIVAAIDPPPPILPKLLIAGAAVLLIAVVGLLLWRGSRAGGGDPADVMGGTPIAIPAGLTEEDLAQVRCVAIVGEHFSYYTEETRLQRTEGSRQWPDMLYELASEEIQAQNRNWYWHEDGSLVSMTPYDLRFLALMPNLEELHICEIEITQAPDLSALKNLDVVWLYDSKVEDLEWLGNSHVAEAQIECAGNLDFSPLGNSEELTCAIFGLHSNKSADLSAFSPPNLKELHLNCGYSPDGFAGADLSGLAGCAKLRKLSLSGMPVRDLSFLQGKTALQELRIDGLGMTSLSGLEDLPVQSLSIRNCDTLRDIAVLGGMRSLKELEIYNCRRLRDYSPVGSCTALERFQIDCDHDSRLRDVSFLRDLPNLKDIMLGGVELQSLDFLLSLSEGAPILTSFGFYGTVEDYSALAAIKYCGSMSLDPDDNVRLEAILPYLENVKIQDLQLRRFAEVDLSTLPPVSSRLELDRCGITDLSTLPEDWKAGRLSLNKCMSLRSLEGLQKQSCVSELDIYNCLRLTDWSALEGMNLMSLSVTGGYMLPEDVNFHASLLRLDSVADVSDLRFLDALDSEKASSFELVGLDDLNNLQPLSRFHGAYLAVSPQLREQAEDLVKAGNFKEYRIEYPEGGWEQDDMELALLSLEELDTLPPALLRRVTSVCIAGDQVIDRERYDIWEDWEHRDKNGNPMLQLYDRETDELSSLSPGVIGDIGMLGALTGLRQLHLWGQPLENLDGIQMLSSLEEFSARGCTSLKDASPIFACPNLREADLKCTSVDSIQGVQNLRELEHLDISNTRIDDLTPLAACDFSAAYARGGLRFHLNELNLDAEDFAVLGTVRRFRELNFTNADPAVWIPALADCEIEHFGAAGDLKSDEDLAALAERHPELRSLYLGWMENVTDLSCLSSLENLESVSIHRDMRKAIASLDGQDYGFRLEIDG